MQSSELKELLKNKLDGAEVIVEGGGCDFRLTIISDQFEGLSTIKRQQLVYSHIKQFIADGTIHAVTLRTFTSSENNQ